MRFNDCCQSWKEKLNQAWGLATTAVRKITLNGTDYTPDGNGAVDLGTIQGGGSTSASDINLTDGRDVQTAIDAIEDEIGDESTAGSIVYRLNNMPIIMNFTQSGGVQNSVTISSPTIIESGTITERSLGNATLLQQNDNRYAFYRATESSSVSATAQSRYGYFYTIGATLQDFIDGIPQSLLNGMFSMIPNGIRVDADLSLSNYYSIRLASNTTYTNYIGRTTIIKDSTGNVTLTLNSRYSTYTIMYFYATKNGTEAPTEGSTQTFTTTFLFGTIYSTRTV